MARCYKCQQNFNWIGQLRRWWFGCPYKKPCRRSV